MYTIYGASWCQYCQKAKVLADEMGLDYETIDLGPKTPEERTPEHEANRERLNTFRPDLKTIPQIWYGDRHIGGYHDFLQFLGQKYNLGR